MPQFIPVTKPEAIELFRKDTRRRFVEAGVYALITLAIVLVIPRFLHQGVAIGALVVVFFYAVVMHRRGKTRMRQSLTALGCDSSAKPVIPYPLSLWHRCSEIAQITPVVGAPFLMGEPLLRTIGILFYVPAVGLGAALYTHGMSGREPTDPSCGKCRYPIDPGTLPTVCPECAAKLTSRSHLTTVPVVRRPSWTIAGGLLFVLGMSVMHITIFGAGRFAATLPRPAQLALAASDGDVFEQLDTTALSPAERDRLVQGIIDAAANERTYRIHPQLEWIAGEIAAGNVPPEQAESLVFAQATLAIIDREITVAQSTAREVSIRLDLPRLTRLHPEYFIQTFPGEPLPQAIDPATPYAETWRLGMSFADRDLYEQRSDTPANFRVPTFILPPNQPAAIKARIVVYVRGTNTPAMTSTITWHDNGTYTITPPPVTHKLFEAERNITAP